MSPTAHCSHIMHIGLHFFGGRGNIVGFVGGLLGTLVHLS
jgi:hypothetical protein